MRPRRVHRESIRDGKYVRVVRCGNDGDDQSRHQKAAQIGKVFLTRQCIGREREEDQGRAGQRLQDDGRPVFKRQVKGKGGANRGAHHTRECKNGG